MVQSHVQAIEQKSSVGHVLHVCTVITHNRFQSRNATARHTSSAPELLWFESPLWATAKGTDSQDLLSARINDENLK